MGASNGRWRRMSAVLLFFGIGMVAARAEPPAIGEARIGDITFRYSPNSWLIAAKDAGLDAGLVARCLQDDCFGAVIDISLRDGEDGCTEDGMKRAAERLLPYPGRAYVNTLRAGRFGLVMAERHLGPELSSPAYAHACVPWQGKEYRFAMRPETVGAQSWIGGALHYLVYLATAPPAPVETLTAADVAFDIPTETWRLAEIAPGERWLLSCRVPVCDKPGIFVSLSVKSPARACNDTDEPLDFIENLGGDRIASEVSGANPESLRFAVTTVHLGCRNYVPPRISACAAHKGRSYHITTSGGGGCRASVWTVPKAALFDLMRSATVRG